MPIWEFDDWADIKDNAKRIVPRINDKVSISVDKKFLYINGIGMPTGPGMTGMIMQSNSVGTLSWVNADSIGVGATGPAGADGDMVFYDSDVFTTPEIVPAIMWSRTKEAFFGYVTGMQGKWVQISSGSMQGATGILGVNGATGVQGVTGRDGGSLFQGYTGVQGIQGATGVRGMGGLTGCLNITIDGRGYNITPGYKGDISVPFNIQLHRWDLFGDTGGSATVNVKKATYASYPTATGMYLGSSAPSLSLSVKNQDTDISDWTNRTAATSDIIRVEVVSSTGLQRLSLNLGYSLV